MTEGQMAASTKAASLYSCKSVVFKLILQNRDLELRADLFLISLYFIRFNFLTESCVKAWKVATIFNRYQWACNVWQELVLPLNWVC